MDRQFRLVSGDAVAAAETPADPDHCQALWAEEFLATKTARGFSPATVESATVRLDRILGVCECYAWDLGAAEIDRALTELAAQGVGSTTRRGYLGELVGFHRFLAARKAAEIERSFGVRLQDPVDEFNACRHVANDSPATRPPPTVQRMDAFFEFLRDRIATSRKYAPAARDYALFRTVFHAGLRGGGDGVAAAQRRALRAGALRQAARPLRQGRQDVGPPAAMGADARRPRARSGLVPQRRPPVLW